MIELLVWGSICKGGPTSLRSEGRRQRHLSGKELILDLKSLLESMLFVICSFVEAFKLVFTL